MLGYEVGGRPYENFLHLRTDIVIRLCTFEELSGAEKKYSSYEYRPHYPQPLRLIYALVSIAWETLPCLVCLVEGGRRGGGVWRVGVEY